MSVVTVKKLKEILDDLDENKLVGYIDNYGKFHPLREQNIYEATGHYDPTNPGRPWQELQTQTNPQRVVNIHIPEVQVRNKA